MVLSAPCSTTNIIKMILVSAILLVLNINQSCAGDKLEMMVIAPNYAQNPLLRQVSMNLKVWWESGHLTSTVEVTIHESREDNYWATITRTTSPSWVPPPVALPTTRRWWTSPRPSTGRTSSPGLPRTTRGRRSSSNRRNINRIRY